jgi:hypothetical protein
MPHPWADHVFGPTGRRRVHRRTISAATPSGQDGFIVHFDVALREYAACCIDDSHRA